MMLMMIKKEEEEIEKKVIVLGVVLCIQHYFYHIISVNPFKSVIILKKLEFLLSSFVAGGRKASKAHKLM